MPPSVQRGKLPCIPRDTRISFSILTRIKHPCRAHRSSLPSFKHSLRLRRLRRRAYESITVQMIPSKKTCSPSQPRLIAMLGNDFRKDGFHVASVSAILFQAKCERRSRSALFQRRLDSRAGFGLRWRIVQVVHRRAPPPERSAFRAQRSGGGGRSLVDPPGQSAGWIARLSTGDQR